jgi:hypothetical protein
MKTATLQTVRNKFFNPYEDDYEMAIVLRYEKKVYSNRPMGWFISQAQTLFPFSVTNIESMAHDSKQAEILKEYLFLDHEFPLTRAIYESVQVYGGPEEGGWYYHKLLPSNLDLEQTKNTEEFIGELDMYGEGFLEYYELVEGEFTNDKRQYYS